MKSERPFTKRDFVVVLACLAFLLMNIAAIGTGGRNRAKEAVCLSNLRKWGAISQTYTQQNNGQFWPSDPGTPCYWWIKYLEDRYKDWKSNRLWFCPTATKPIFDEYGNSAATLNIFNAWGIYRGDQMGPNGIAGCYAINGYLLIPTPPHAPSQYDGGVPVSDGWKTTGVAGADNIPVFIEALRFDVWPLHMMGPADYEFAAWSGNNMARCCINRHNGAVNCLFLDFSARKVGLKELWTLRWHRSFDTEGPWTIAGGVQPTDWPEWIRNFRDY